MAKNKGSSQAETEKRIRSVQEWMMSGNSTSDIITQCCNLYGVERRQAYKYVEKAYKNFKELSDNNMEERRAFHIEARLKLYRDLKEKNTPRVAAVAVDILKDIAKLEGLYVDRQEIDITSDGERITGINYIVPKENENNN